MGTAGPFLGLAAKVSVNQEHGFNGQVFQFQIPGGVVGSNVPDGHQALAIAPLLRIVIVEVGHPLDFFLVFRAEFANVMYHGRPGQEDHVYRDSGFLQLEANGQGHPLNANDVGQQVKVKELPPQAQNFINIIHFPNILQAGKFFGVGAGGNLLRRQRHKIQPLVQTVQPAVGAQKKAQQVQAEKGGGPKAL